MVGKPHIGAAFAVPFFAARGQREIEGPARDLASSWNIQEIAHPKQQIALGFHPERAILPEHGREGSRVLHGRDEYQGDDRSRRLTRSKRRRYKRRVDDQRLNQEIGDQDRLLLVFAYLGPLALFALVASRKEFVKWHAKQGVLLSCAVALVWIGARGVYLLIRERLWPLFGALFSAAAALTALGLVPRRLPVLGTRAGRRALQGAAPRRSRRRHDPLFAAGFPGLSDPRQRPRTVLKMSTRYPRRTPSHESAAPAGRIRDRPRRIAPCVAQRSLRSRRAASHRADG
jgi:hypothetical protein